MPLIVVSPRRSSTLPTAEDLYNPPEESGKHKMQMFCQGVLAPGYG
jgi:hypothetical protein